MKPVPLTKTRFTMAMECPRKLDYARDKSYYDARSNDELLQSLAEGGHQVGELARQMYPGGIMVEDFAADDQVKTTQDLLTRHDVTIFEATIRHLNLLVRCDILVKRGNQVSLIEVKAKGFDPTADQFLSKKGAEPIISSWRPYLYDVAYQAHVLGLAHPGLTVTPYLYLLDKSVAVAIPGLNTMLPVTTVGRRVTVSVAPSFDARQLNPSVLHLVDVSSEVEQLLAHPVDVSGQPQRFEEFVAHLSDVLSKGQSFPVNVGPSCKK